MTYQDANLIDVYLPGDVDRDGDVDQADLGALLTAWGKCQGEQGYNPNADFNGDGCVNQSDFGILLGRWGTTNTSLQIRYTWDAENRLVGVEPVFPSSSADKKVAFTYDYLGRRVRKQIFDWDPNTNGIPNACDIASGTSDDYDFNGVPDECDPDCNTNGVPDACDLCATGNCSSHPLPVQERRQCPLGLAVALAPTHVSLATSTSCP